MRFRGFFRPISIVASAMERLARTRQLVGESSSSFPGHAKTKKATARQLFSSAVLHAYPNPRQRKDTIRTVRVAPSASFAIADM